MAGFIMAYIDRVPFFHLKLKAYPPASKESREVANLTERKNPHLKRQYFSGRAWELKMVILQKII